MADSSGPLKPLKILTIDGGGLQAITSLLILDKLLAEIARNNKVSNLKPRPCDVFDAIAGIGAGGWLAILLGRFHMDITACLAEWYKITSCIAPKSKSGEIFMRLLHHCYFNPDHLLEQIDKLTELYETGEYLYGKDSDNVRTRHVFVAALKSDAKGYKLFRSYEVPASAKMPDKLLEGPQNPGNYKISRAFGATGAARYFTPPWKEQMATSGMMHFRNNKFYRHHNITELALDEMWGLYGKDVPLSVIINIGPGAADPYDIKRIARRFSWGLDLPQVRPAYPKRARSPISPTAADDIPLTKKISRFSRKGRKNRTGSREHFVRFDDSQVAQNPVSVGSNKGQPVNRCGTFGSIKDQTIEKKLKREGRKIVDDIKLKLDNIYGEGSGQNLYHRLAPEKSPQGTALNDSTASRACLETAREYASDHSDEISGIARRISESDTPTPVEVV